MPSNYINHVTSDIPTAEQEEEAREFTLLETFRRSRSGSQGYTATPTRTHAPRLRSTTLNVGMSAALGYSGHMSNLRAQWVASNSRLVSQLSTVQEGINCQPGFNRTLLDSELGPVEGLGREALSRTLPRCPQVANVGSGSSSIHHRIAGPMSFPSSCNAPALQDRLLAKEKAMYDRRARE